MTAKKQPAATALSEYEQEAIFDEIEDELCDGFAIPSQVLTFYRKAVDALAENIDSTGVHRVEERVRAEAQALAFFHHAMRCSAFALSVTHCNQGIEHDRN